MNESPFPHDEPSGGGANDYALLRGIANRDTSCLASLYDQRGPLLFALCLRILKDRMAAEEALEDVFMELWNKADRFDPQRGTPINYLLNLTQCRAIDKLRGGAKLRRMQLATDRQNGDSPEIAFPAQARDSVTPADSALQAERSQTVRRAVDRLNPEQRQAVELAFFEGLTHTQISEKLSVPLGTIKTRIRQGLVHLKEAMGKHFGYGSPGADQEPFD